MEQTGSHIYMFRTVLATEQALSYCLYVDYSDGGSRQEERWAQRASTGKLPLLCLPGEMLERQL